MEETLCDISAFRFHRIPPFIRETLPTVPSFEEDRERYLLNAHSLTRELGGTPVHMLVTDRTRRTCGKTIRHHLINSEAIVGQLQDTTLGIKVTSPLFTLFQLAQSISELHLLMAMYEFCGTFSVYAPSSQVESALANEANLSFASRRGWRRVRTGKGEPTSLWSRPPLIGTDELRAYAEKMKGWRGSRAFARAANDIAGIVASPFEAQLAILLSYPRRKGGEGLNGFTTNERIPLTARAKRIAGKNTCYADILFEKADKNKPLVIECQGKIIHDNRKAAISDSDRLTALQQMGFDAMLLTYSQIVDPTNFNIVCKLIFNKLGLKYRGKDSRQLFAEHELRRHLFIDWKTLGQ